MLNLKNQMRRGVAPMLIALAMVLASSVGCASRTGSRGIDAAPVKGAASASSKATLGKDFWVCDDGTKFPCTCWGSRTNPETVVIAVHGLSGAASDFKPLGEYLNKRSITTYSYALRGQGNDPRKDRIGDIKDPNLWYSDLDTFVSLVREAHPRARLFLYGESLGGLISVHGMRALSVGNRRSIRGLILSSPVVSLKDRDKLSRIKYFALETAIRLMPHRMISLEKLAGDKKDMHITGDTDHRENIRDTPHAVDKYSFRLLGTLENLIDGSRERAAIITKPILVLYPANDLLTTPEDVEKWFSALGTKDKEKHLFSQSYHMLLHDKERDQVLETVGSWLDRH